jgi:signal transduction histidine kinase
LAFDVAQRNEFETEVGDRFGILPNFFRSAAAAPELVQQLWGFAKAGYLDNPMPSLFKERLFVWLSRLCPMRYCIVRHVGFLLGDDHGRAAGDAAAGRQTIEDVVRLLQRPSPWRRDMAPVYELLEGLTATLETWPAADSELEDAIFACAAMMFAEPARSERARRALLHTLGARRLEFFNGCLAFIRTAHYWTMLHPEIETEEDMRAIMRGHEELARLLLEDPEAERCEMGGRLFEELITLRELHERQELEQAKLALEEKDRQKDLFIAILAHELRNPVGAISAAADAMGLLRLQDPRAVQLVERLDRQTTAISRMLEDLLDASRIALGQVSVRLERLRLQDLLTDAANEHQERAQAAGLRLLAKFTSNPCDVAADRVRLRQIVDNLLSNAIKFTPPGGTVQLSLVDGATHAEVAVQDSGAGFDEQFARQLFEPFTSISRVVIEQAAGSGSGFPSPADWPGCKADRSQRRARDSGKGRCSPCACRSPIAWTSRSVWTRRRRTAAARPYSSWKTTRTWLTAWPTCWSYRVSRCMSPSMGMKRWARRASSFRISSCVISGCLARWTASRSPGCAAPTCRCNRFDWSPSPATVHPRIMPRRWTRVLSTCSPSR